MAGKREAVSNLKTIAGKKGFITPEEILTIYPEPEKNIDEIEHLIGKEIEIAEQHNIPVFYSLSELRAHCTADYTGLHG